MACYPEASLDEKATWGLSLIICKVNNFPWLVLCSIDIVYHLRMVTMLGKLCKHFFIIFFDTFDPQDLYNYQTTTG